MREVGDGRSSYSASSFMRMLLGERRSLEGVVKVKWTKGGEEDDRRDALGAVAVIVTLSRGVWMGAFPGRVGRTVVHGGAMVVLDGG